MELTGWVYQARTMMDGTGVPSEFAEMYSYKYHCVTIHRKGGNVYIGTRHFTHKSGTVYEGREQ